jgi:hypothetical protein
VGSMIQITNNGSAHGDADNNARGYVFDSQAENSSEAHPKGNTYPYSRRTLFHHIHQ